MEQCLYAVQLYALLNTLCTHTFLYFCEVQNTPIHKHVLVSILADTKHLSLKIDYVYF